MGLFKKNGVSPLPYEDFEYYTKDTIIYKNEKMRLAEYNREFNKSLKEGQPTRRVSWPLWGKRQALHVTYAYAWRA